ncbi:hypothetical protein [Desulfonatronovibrio hydrogenovorans]|nr:hypothetical protein [Desulfonatronovibrio hydrogenovorans]
MYIFVKHRAGEAGPVQGFGVHLFDIDIKISLGPKSEEYKGKQSLTPMEA